MNHQKNHGSEESPGKSFNSACITFKMLNGHFEIFQGLNSIDKRIGTGNITITFPAFKRNDWKFIVNLYCKLVVNPELSTAVKRFIQNLACQLACALA